MNQYDALIENLLAWALSSGEIKAAVMVGSRARADRPADEYSELDLALVVSDPELFLTTNRWLDALGYLWLSFVEDTVGGGKERRVLFEGALDVDFILFPVQGIQQTLAMGEVQSLLNRGYRILMDEIGLIDDLAAIPPFAQAMPPSPIEFTSLVNNFWYHSVWAAKKLCRGELWMAKSCVDSYMKELLLRMIEIHAHAANGWQYDTWHSGRFLDQWVEQKVRDSIQFIFARYNKDEIGRALLETMELFRLLAIEAAEKLGFEYPADADKHVTEWVKKALRYLE
jgi:aminoglycoside 6-adenylyltransferase